MSDVVENTPATEAPLSTAIEARSDAASVGAGTPDLTPADDGAEKIASIDDAINAASKEIDKETPAEPEQEAEDKEPPKKPAPEKEKPEGEEEEPEEAEEEKPVKPKPEVKTTEGEPEDARPQRRPAPRDFQGRAAAQWTSTPRSVQEAVFKLERDYEEKLSRSSAVRQEWQQVEPYAEMAKKSGTTLPVALARYVEAEKAIQENPVAGITAIMRNAGLDPAKFAQMVLQNPDGYRQELIKGQQQFQQRSTQAKDDQLAQMQRQVEAMQQSQAADRVRMELIEPFRAANPRFDELQEQVAKFLNSDIIDRNLSPAERLQQAFSMAERLYPASGEEPEENSEEENEKPRKKPGKSKQVSGSPSSGTRSGARRKMSIDEAIAAASV